METGSTTLAFTPIKQHEADITGGVQAPDPGHKPRPNIDISLSVYDVNQCLEVSGTPTASAAHYTVLKHVLYSTKTCAVLNCVQ